MRAARWIHRLTQWGFFGSFFSFVAQVSSEAFYSFVAHDAIWAVARALDTVLTDCGGAASCNDSPGSATFQRALRKQLFLSNFTGITGAFSLTQCTGADYTLDSLGLNSMNNTCGDREQRYHDLMNWNGSQWLNVSDLFTAMS